MLDVFDLIIKFRSWWYEGYNACRQNMSIGLGSNTQQSLERFDTERPDILTGGVDPQTDAGNGALMRLAPVPVYWHQDLQTAMSMAKLQAQVGVHLFLARSIYLSNVYIVLQMTHNVQEAMDTSLIMTFMMWQAIHGADKTSIFSRLSQIRSLVEHTETADLLDKAPWRTASEKDIVSLPSRCLWSLEAALWCVFNTDSFEQALITAINLCGDSDTIGAITGQIAGALYGCSQIPARWLECLKHRDCIERKAVALYKHKQFCTELMLHYPIAENR